MTLLGDDPPSEFMEVLVICALVWGGLGVFAPLFRPRLERLGQTLPSSLVAVTRVGWSLLILVIVVPAVIFNEPDVIPAAVVALWALTLVGSWFASGSPMYKAKPAEKAESVSQPEGDSEAGPEPSGTERD
jgi:hypothetical protein